METWRLQWLMALTLKLEQMSLEQMSNLSKIWDDERKAMDHVNRVAEALAYIHVSWAGRKEVKTNYFDPLLATLIWQSSVYLLGGGAAKVAAGRPLLPVN